MPSACARRTTRTPRCEVAWTTWKRHPVAELNSAAMAIDTASAVSGRACSSSAYVAIGRPRARSAASISPRSSQCAPSRPPSRATSRHTSSTSPMPGGCTRFSGSLVAEVVDQHQGAAAQGVAPEELYPDGAAANNPARSRRFSAPRVIPHRPKSTKPTRAVLRGAVLEDGRVGDRRDGVGHLEQRGDAAHGGGPRGMGEVLLVGQPGITRMDVRIDEAGKDQQPAGVDLNVDRASSRVRRRDRSGVGTRHRPRPTRRWSPAFRS